MDIQQTCCICLSLKAKHEDANNNTDTESILEHVDRYS
jgi:hypothetical protein